MTVSRYKYSIIENFFLKKGKNPSTIHYIVVIIGENEANSRNYVYISYSHTFCWRINCVIMLNYIQWLLIMFWCVFCNFFHKDIVQRNCSSVSRCILHIWTQSVLSSVKCKRLASCWSAPSSFFSLRSTLTLLATSSSIVWQCLDDCWNAHPFPRTFDMYR